jgi:hypothetical protein
MGVRDFGRERCETAPFDLRRYAVLLFEVVRSSRKGNYEMRNQALAPLHAIRAKLPSVIPSMTMRLDCAQTIADQPTGEARQIGKRKFTERHRHKLFLKPIASLISIYEATTRIRDRASKLECIMPCIARYPRLHARRTCRQYSTKTLRAHLQSKQRAIKTQSNK